jgi:hypothetical protein
MIIEKRIGYVNLFWSDFPQTPKHIYQLVHLDETRPNFFFVPATVQVYERRFPLAKEVFIPSFKEKAFLASLGWLSWSHYFSI